MHTLLAALGQPQRQLRVAHITGTKGKGSTATMLSAILQAAQYRVGTYTRWDGIVKTHVGTCRFGRPRCLQPHGWCGRMLARWESP